MTEQVSRPGHYVISLETGSVEVRDIICDVIRCHDPVRAYHVGSAIKYILRAGRKRSGNMSLCDSALVDLKKAREFLDFEISRAEE